MLNKYKEHVHLFVAVTILAGSFIATAVVFADDTLPHAHNVYLPTMKTNEASVNALQVEEQAQPSLLLEAFGVEVYERLRAGELPWELELQLTPEQWDEWYTLDKVVAPSILLDAYGPTVYAQLLAGHYPPDLALPFTQEHWDAWYTLDRMGDDDLPFCPQNDLSTESLLSHGIIPRGEGDMRPLCLVIPEIVIDHTQAISDVLARGGSLSDIGLSDDPRIVRPDLYEQREE